MVYLSPADEPHSPRVAESSQTSTSRWLRPDMESRAVPTESLLLKQSRWIADMEDNWHGWS